MAEQANLGAERLGGQGLEHEGLDGPEPEGLGHHQSSDFSAPSSTFPRGVSSISVGFAPSPEPGSAMDLTKTNNLAEPKDFESAQARAVRAEREVSRLKKHLNTILKGSEETEHLNKTLSNLNLTLDKIKIELFDAKKKVSVLEEECKGLKEENEDLKKRMKFAQTKSRGPGSKASSGTSGRQIRGSRNKITPELQYPGEGSVDGSTDLNSLTSRSKSGGKKKKYTQGKAVAGIMVSRGSAAGYMTWKTDKKIIDAKSHTAAVLAAFFGLTGSLCSFIVHELVVNGKPTDDLIVEVLKGINTCCSLTCLFFVFRLHWLDELLDRLQSHVKYNVDLHCQVSWLALLSDRWLWLEILIVLPHLPPRCSFLFESDSMGNLMLHRSETLDAAYGLLRIYLLWRLVETWSLNDLPGRHSVATQSGVDIGAKFAFKRLLDSGLVAVVIVAIFWSWQVLVLGYWFRNAEVTACQLPGVEYSACTPESQIWTMDGSTFFTKFNDLWIFNGCWLMFVTSSTVGLGDILPSTQFGRALAGISALMGTILTALFTASLGNFLRLSASESAALALLTRDHYKTRLEHKAGMLIREWWYLRKKGKDDRSLVGRILAVRVLAFKKMKEEFNWMKTQARLDAEECTSEEHKMKQIVKLLNEAEDDVEGMFKHMASAPGNGSLMMPFAANQEATSFADQFASIKIGRAHSGPASASVSQDGSPRSRKMLSISENKKRARPAEDGSEDLLADFESKFENLPWRRNRYKVKRKMDRAAFAAMLFGLLGAVFAVISTELIFNSGSPKEEIQDILKIANSLCTVACTFFVVRVHNLDELLDRIQSHLISGERLNTQVSLFCVFRRRAVWAELFVCLVHLPPFMTFEIGVVNHANFVLYRAETLFCLWNILRIYLMMRVLRSWSLSGFRKLYTVSSVCRVELDYRFAIKYVLTGNQAEKAIAVIWGTGILIFGYWIRASEATACRLWHENEDCNLHSAKHWYLNNEEIAQDSLFRLQNSMWLTYAIMTTVGYGDFAPVTHLGRSVALLAAFFGVTMLSLLTAALTVKIRWRQKERDALTLLHMRKTTLKVQRIAVHAIKMWWRYMKLKQSGKGLLHGIGSEALKFRMKSSLMNLRHSKIEEKNCREDIIACGSQIDRIFRLTRTISATVQYLHKSMTDPYSVCALSSPPVFEG